MSREPLLLLLHRIIPPLWVTLGRGGGTGRSVAPPRAVVVLICSRGEVKIVKLVCRSLTVFTCSLVLSLAQYTLRECCWAEIQSLALFIWEHHCLFFSPSFAPSNPLALKCQPLNLTLFLKHTVHFLHVCVRLCVSYICIYSLHICDVENHDTL